MRNFEIYKSAVSRYLGRSLNYIVEFSHSAWDNPYRLINNTTQIEYEGETYTPYPFQITLPTQGQDEGTSIILSNIDDELMQLFEQTIYSNENIICTLYLVQLEKVQSGILVDAEPKGTFEVVSAAATVDALNLGLDFKSCLPYNLGVYRFNQTNFGNLYK